MDAQSLALLLLILRIVATALITAVVVRQIHNIRTLRTDYPVVRITIMALTIVVLIGQFIPITLDSVVAFTHTNIGRKNPPDLLSSSYALNNAIKDVVIGALLAFLHFRPGARSGPDRRS